MRVILDGVFNHCGSFNKWLDREKIYDDAEDLSQVLLQQRTAHTIVISISRMTTHFPDNLTYEGWWGHDTLPKLNYEESPELEAYILNVAKKWVSPPYNCRRLASGCGS